jgi:hypothetical protein
VAVSADTIGPATLRYEQIINAIRRRNCKRRPPDAWDNLIRMVSLVPSCDPARGMCFHATVDAAAQCDLTARTPNDRPVDCQFGLCSASCASTPEVECNDAKYPLGSVPTLTNVNARTVGDSECVFG